MKKYFILIPTLFYIGTTFAQKGKTTISFYGGISLPKYSYNNGGGSEDRKIYQGYTGGINLMVYDISKEVPGLGFGVGVNYIQAGGINKSPAILNAVESKNRINYLQGEFLTGIKLAKFLEIHGGVYISKAVNGQTKTKYIDNTVITTDLKFGTTSADDFNPYDLGLSFNTFFNISKIKLGFSLHQGLGDIAPQDNIKIRNEIYSVVLGFSLGGGKK